MCNVMKCNDRKENVVFTLSDHPSQPDRNGNLHPDREYGFRVEIEEHPNYHGEYGKNTKDVATDVTFMKWWGEWEN